MNINSTAQTLANTAFFLERGGGPDILILNKVKDYSEITLSKLINETLIQEEEHKYYMYTTQIFDNGLQLKSCTQFSKPLEREQQISRLKAEKTEYERLF